MDNQVLYIGLAVMTVSCLYLLYKNYQTKKFYEQEMIKIKEEMANNIKAIVENKQKQNLVENIENFEIKENINESNLNLEGNLVNNEFNHNNKNDKKALEESSTYNILKTQYDNYTNSEQYESNSEDRFNTEMDSDLKYQIDNLDNVNKTQNENNIESEEILETKNTIPENEIILNNQQTEVIKEEQESKNIEELNIENLDNNSDLNININTNPINIDNIDNIDIKEQSDNIESGTLKIDNLENLEFEELNTEKLTLTEHDIQDISKEISEKDNNLLSQIINKENTVSSTEIFDINLDENKEEKKEENNENNENNENKENYCNYTKKELEKMTLKQLQQLAKENKIKVKGRKDELIERFIEKKTLN